MPQPGVTVLFNLLPTLSKLAEQRAEAIVAQYAHAIEAGIKASMATPKSGRTYRTGDVTRNLGKSERAGVGVTRSFGKLVAVTAGGLRVNTAPGGASKVVIGARIHRASAPGEAPAVDTGHYINSIRAKRSAKLQWMVYTNAEQARALEYGNPARNLLPRPHFRPAADAVRSAFVRDMAQVVRL
jgi:hypothetical protein